MLNKGILILSCLLSFHVSMGQEYRLRSSLQSPSQSGFYRIAVTPELSARVKSDLSDLRIYNGDQQVPYIKEDPSRFPGSIFRQLPVVKNFTDTSGTTIVLDASRTTGLDNLSLVIANTAVERTASLSGSNDGRSWFIIHESLVLANTGTNKEGQYMQSLRFPYTRYPYFKVVVNNRGTDPMNIIAAGLFEFQGDTDPVFEVHPGTVIATKDSAGKSFVFIQNQEPYLVDRMALNINSPKYYDREVNVYTADSNARKQNWISTARLVSQGITPAIELTGVQSQYFLLEISNGDNPPLQIDKLETQSRPRSIIAWLEKGKEYHLLAGNTRAPMPQYDLTQFRDSIPKELPSLTYASFVENSFVKEEKKSRNWLWPAIIAMLGILAFLTFRLMGEMKGRQM